MNLDDKKSVLSATNNRLAWKLSLIVLAGLLFAFAIVQKAGFEWQG
jgi:hypothetical protein